VALSSAYDALEARIADLQAREELDAIRPDLDGNEIMQILGIPPGPAVGRAWAHLKEQRMQHGPLGHDEAVAELRRWWAAQS
jgi:poly(A) polymerase